MPRFTPATREAFLLLAQGPLPEVPDWLAVGDKAYGLLQPQVVAHDVLRGRWSPCGRSRAAARAHDPGPYR